MSPKQRSPQWLAVVGAGLLAMGTTALAQPATNYEPKSGQPGKDVVWVPTPQSLVDRMLDMAKATPQDYVIDLGSGDGRTVITAAKRGIKAHGIEYNPDLAEWPSATRCRRALRTRRRSHTATSSRATSRRRRW